VDITCFAQTTIHPTTYKIGDIVYTFLPQHDYLCNLACWYVTESITCLWNDLLRCVFTVNTEESSSMPGVSSKCFIVLIMLACLLTISVCTNIGVTVGVLRSKGKSSCTKS